VTHRTVSVIRQDVYIGESYSQKYDEVQCRLTSFNPHKGDKEMR
jgi:hypothetical protein